MGFSAPPARKSEPFWKRLNLCFAADGLPAVRQAACMPLKTTVNRAVQPFTNHGLKPTRGSGVGRMPQLSRKSASPHLPVAMRADGATARQP